MRLELVTVGTELLLGFTHDTNAADIAQALAAVGGIIDRRATVGDDHAQIHDAVSQALERTRFVVVTGGLGPTRDDVTKRAVAELFGAPLELDEAYLETLRERFARFGRGPMPPSNRSQAEVPRGATVLPNPRGTAPGLWLEGTPGVAVLLPGVPHEMRGLLAEQVVPRVRARIAEDGGAARVTLSRALRTSGIGESALADLLTEVEPRLPPITLAYLPQLAGVDLRLTAWRLPPAEAGLALERAAEALRAALGRHLYGEGDTALAAVVLDLLRARGYQLALAESCTGGLVGAAITSVPGASATFLGGIVSYADVSKVRDLGVDAALIERHGAVSQEVALAMADGAAKRFGVAAAAAVTGIAGPGGGTSEKPIGTVCLAARVGPLRRTVRRWLPGDRLFVRERSVQAVLDLVRRLLLEEADTEGGSG
jgi:nicotinamide-nucleotide amidase